MGRSRITDSPEETLAFGQALGKKLVPDTVLALTGELGAGKTLLIKGIVWGATGIAPEEVNSPTFVYLNIYGQETQKPVYHFDLYRLRNPDEFLSLGFEEYFLAQGLCCIEWSERIKSILPPNHLTIALSHAGDKSRLIEII